MKKFLIILGGIAAMYHRLCGHVAMANLITATRYNNGIKTYTANEAVLRNALVKFDTTETTVLNCATTAIPIGIANAELASGDPGAIRVLGACPGTEIGIADAAIAKDALLAPGTTAGRIRTLPATTGTWWVVGKALTAAGAAADEFEFAPCAPYKVVVP